MHINPNKLCLNKIQKLFIISYIIIIFLSLNIKCSETNKTEFNKEDFKFNGVYRIDTFLKNRTLTYKYKNLELSRYNNLNNHFRIYLSDIRPFYYIELKSENKKLGIISKYNLYLFNKNNNRVNKRRIRWKIIEISPNQYLIKNQYNKKYLEKNGFLIQCNHNYYRTNKNKDLFKFTFFKLFEEPVYKPEYLDIIEKEEIDIVIKYIDLTDKTLNRKGIKQIKKDEDNEELRYSLRSIVQYIPWVRKIFIVMPNKKVKFLKDIEEIKEKINYIKDKDILGFDSANNQAFVLNYYKLSRFGVSNNFIYMDDDYFIGQHLNKSDFFYYDENEKKVKPCLINFYFNEFNKKKVFKEYNKLFKIKNKINPHSYLGWKLALLCTETFLFNNYNKSHLIYTEFTHNAIPMNIIDLKEIYKELQNYKYINETIYSIERFTLRILVQYFYCLYYLNIKKRKVHTIPYNYLQIENINPNDLFSPLFVINTAEKKIYNNNVIRRGIETIKRRFPTPTLYEVSDDILFTDEDNTDNTIIYKYNIIIYTLIFILIIAIIIYCIHRIKKKTELIKYTQIVNEEKYHF